MKTIITIFAGFGEVGAPVSYLVSFLCGEIEEILVKNNDGFALFFIFCYSDGFALIM